MCIFYMMLILLPTSDGICVSSPRTCMDLYKFLNCQIVVEVILTDHKLGHKGIIVLTCFFPLSGHVSLELRATMKQGC